MSVKNLQGLKEYISKVCKDACISEQRPIHVDYQYAIVEDKLIFAVRTKYQRVTRRINYRLDNNIGKNFGLVFCNVEDIYSKIDFVSECIDPNFSFASWVLFGKWGTLRCGEDSILNPHLHISCHEYGEKNKYQRLCEAGYCPNLNYGENTAEEWKEFCDYHERVFGDRPYEVKDTVSVSLRG